MSAQCIPSEVLKEQGQEFDLQITIPDGLGESMFPLEFSIEAVELSITPKNDDMPVSSGTSTIENSASGRVGKSSFWFVKTLSYEEYKPIAVNNNKKSFLCHFATNKAISATDIYVSNPYFNQTSCKLGNYDPKSFLDLEYKPKEDGTVTFNFRTSARPSSDITVTLTGLAPADDEDKLTWVGEDANGNPMYTLAANDENLYTLNLDPADAETDFNVKLEAYQFVTAQASVNSGKMDFIDPKLPDTKVGYNQSVNFTFTYADSVVPVRIKLTNLVSDDARLAENDGVFVFTPTPNKKEQTISLKTNSWGSQIGVEIVAAEGYNVPVSVTANRTLKATVSTGVGWGTEIYYSFDKSLNTSSAIGSQIVWYGSITISLSGDQVEDASRIVYFWYYSSWGKTKSTSITLDDLAKSSPKLTFK